MFQFKGRWAAAIGTCALMLAAPLGAEAAVMTVTYTGDVVAGIDETGVFGAPATYLEGSKFIATFRYDTTLGTPFAPPGFDGDYLIGGSAFSVASPILDATLTINGVTYDVPGGYSDHIRTGFAYFNNGQPPHQDLFTQVLSGPLAQDFLTVTAVPLLAAPMSLSQPFSADVTGLDGSAQSQRYDSDGNLTLYFLAALAPTHVEVAAVGAPVPEPASWALLLLGFAATGMAMRRRGAPASF